MGHLEKVSVISIVDDDESVARQQAASRSLDFTAYTFASAEEFLRSPHVNDTSCLISDVQMPSMSGVELQSHLIARGHRTPIIFITAFPDESIQARALKAGAVCFLNKPVDGMTLLRCLEEVLKNPEGGIA